MATYPAGTETLASLDAYIPNQILGIKNFF